MFPRMTDSVKDLEPTRTSAEENETHRHSADREKRQTDKQESAPNRQRRRGVPFIFVSP